MKKRGSGFNSKIWRLTLTVGCCEKIMRKRSVPIIEVNSIKKASKYLRFFFFIISIVVIIIVVISKKSAHCVGVNGNSLSMICVPPSRITIVVSVNGV